MKQLIEHLRRLHRMYPRSSDRVGMGALIDAWEAIPQLLDRLEKLEAVAQAAKKATTEPDKMKRAGYINGLNYALAALEDK